MSRNVRKRGPALSRRRMERREAPAFPQRNAALNDNGRATRRSIPLAF